MLDLMRRKAGSWIIKFIVFAIAVVFIFFGVGNYRERSRERIASVNGEPISLKEYNRAYDNLVENYRQRMGDNFNAEMLKTFNVRKQALDKLIEQKLLVAEARNIHFSVSDEELSEAIQQEPVFKVGAGFDKDRYTQILSRYGMTPQEFELSQKEMMVISKLRTFVEGNIKVSEKEAQEWYKWKNAMVDLDFVLFKPGKAEEVNISREEMLAFFEKNKADYKTEPTVKVRYLVFKPTAYLDKTDVSEEMMKEYYDTNQSRFNKSKTVAARHILIKVAPEADSEAVDKALKKAQGIYEKAKSGKDFAELAKTYSDGPSRVKGGDLGEFGENDMVKPFTEKAFAMEAGQISEPVRTEFGWHIIKVEKVNPARTIPWEEAKTEIRKKLTDDQTKDLAGDAAEMVYEATYEESDLDKIAEQYTLEVITTDHFTQSTSIEGVGNKETFATVAFDLPEMGISDIHDFDDGYYILQTLDKKPGEIPPFKDVEAFVRSKMTGDRLDEMAGKQAEAFLNQLKKGEAMEALSQKANLVIATTGFFQRSGEIPKIGYEQDINRIAFGLSKQNRFPDKPIKGGAGYYVIRFKERKTSDLTGFEEAKADLLQELLRYKKMAVYGAWMTKIKEKSEIDIQEGFLN
jgi:peptidyl-prolyl cis-trans isomerase D